MNAKKTMYIIAILALVLVSCEKFELGNDFLEKEPSIDVTKDTIFSTVELAERYLWSGYRTLPYGLPVGWGAKDMRLGMDMLVCLTDMVQSNLAWGGAGRIYYPGQYSAAEENDSKKTKYSYTKEESWIGIRIGWNFAENIDRVPDASENYKAQLKAEAKMLVAIHYTDMYRHFGGMPWVDHAYTPTESLYLPRLTSLETMEKIVALLDDEIIPYLPLVINDLSNDDGRFTKAAAMGLKARVLLFGASPLFNNAQPYLAGEASAQKLTWHGGYDANLWTRAAQAAKDVLDLGSNALVNTGNPRQDFQNAYYARGNGEVLISTRVGFKSGGYWSGYYFYQSAGNYGTACATKEYVDMFPMADGTPINDTGSGWDPNFPWANRDPRLYETVLVNGDAFRGRTAELWVGGRDRLQYGWNNARWGFGARKFWLDGNSSTSVGSIVHWPYLRLSEIYLSYAEAANEANGGPTAEAYNAINEVRNRVGLNNLSTGLSQEEFREAVLTERACEFGYEEVRWFDIIRWKMENVFTQGYHGVDTYGDNVNGPFTYETIEVPERAWRTDPDFQKYYLSAFPPDEINKDYGLIQNPGW